MLTGISIQESMFSEQLLNAVLLWRWQPSSHAYTLFLFGGVFISINWYVLAYQFIWKFQILWNYENKNHCVWNSDYFLFGGLFELINMTKKH